MNAPLNPLATGETVIYRDHEYIVEEPGLLDARNAELHSISRPGIILFVDPVEFIDPGFDAE